jgi:hypothetical protein
VSTDRAMSNRAASAWMADLWPGTGLHPAHVEHVGALVDQEPGPSDQVVEGERGAFVVERVRGPVEDPHDQWSIGDIERPGPEAEGGGAHGMTLPEGGDG